MDLKKIKSNQLKTICQFSIPSIIAMVLTSMITIADGFFTGKFVGDEGIAAVNLGIPIVYFYLGIGLMISVGGSTLASMTLGKGDKNKGNAIFNQTMLTTIVASFAVSLVVLFSLSPVLNILHVDGQVANYFKDYYTIMLVALPILIINSAFGMFIRGEGKPQVFMKNCIINCLGNIILDYIFAGKMNMGIEGIAIASLLSSCICLILIIRYFLFHSTVYKLKKFNFNKEILKRSIYNGLSEFITEISMCITMFGYNFVILKNIGVDGVTAYTVVGYVAYIFNMIIIGFGQGISPIVSFAYGAKEKILAKDLRKKTNIFVFGIGIVIVIFMMFSLDWYSSIFIKGENIIDMVKSGIPIFVLSFLFAGINTITAFYFISIGSAKEATIISSLRGFIILLICIFVLPPIFGMMGVWMVAPVTELITLPVCIYFLIKNDLIIKKQKNKLIEE